ncbi:hypothetical protein J6590_016211 [Homalodisca vitripennis]|nr:hypothetical protein J6590_016211 [Homalodisca vitripennis]
MERPEINTICLNPDRSFKALIAAAGRRGWILIFVVAKQQLTPAPAFKIIWFLPYRPSRLVARKISITGHGSYCSLMITTQKMYTPEFRDETLNHSDVKTVLVENTSDLSAKVSLLFITHQSHLAEIARQERDFASPKLVSSQPLTS